MAPGGVGDLLDGPAGGLVELSVESEDDLLNAVGQPGHRLARGGGEVVDAPLGRRGDSRIERARAAFSTASRSPRTRFRRRIDPGEVGDRGRPGGDDVNAQVREIVAALGGGPSGLDDPPLGDRQVCDVETVISSLSRSPVISLSRQHRWRVEPVTPDSPPNEMRPGSRRFGCPRAASPRWSGTALRPASPADVPPWAMQRASVGGHG